MLRPRGKKRTIYFKRRVPTRFAEFYSSDFVELSLKTDSMDEAEEKAKAIWDQLMNGWQDREAGQSEDAEKRFEAARRIARTYGFRYRKMAELSQSASQDVLDRIAVIPTARAKPDQNVAAAVLGAVDAPELTVTTALDRYWSLTKAEVRDKSPDQLRRWQNPLKKAVKNFVAVVGDLPLSELQPDDFHDFQDWWLQRLDEENLSANSVNKDFSHLSTILGTVIKKLRLPCSPPVKGWRIPQGDAASPPPYDDDYLRGVLVPHLLSPECGLNDQARDIALIMVNTGARPSEIANLQAQHITLTGVPHISITPEGRQLKTKTSKRKLPLLGVALDAAARHPNGFPRYVDSPSLSATVNKYLRMHNLAPTSRHVMYSLRHGFEDRMLAAGIDERVRRDVMGHSLGDRQRYGDGLPMADLRDMLSSLAI
jgi:integrase